MDIGLQKLKTANAAYVVQRPERVVKAKGGQRNRSRPPAKPSPRRAVGIGALGAAAAFSSRLSAGNKSRSPRSPRLENGGIPVNYIMTGPDDKIRQYQQRCYIKIENNPEAVAQSEEGVGSSLASSKAKLAYAVNWNLTPLYDYYTQNFKALELDKAIQINALNWDQRLYKEDELDELLQEIKANFDQYVEKDSQGPIYLKALVTLKFLFNEQAIDLAKFQKVRQLYGEISIENTLKLLIRCKILFTSRLSLLDLFESIKRYEATFKKLGDQLEILKPESQDKDDEGEDIEITGDQYETIKALADSYIETVEKVIAKGQLLSSGKNKNLRGKSFYYHGVEYLHHIKKEFEGVRARLRNYQLKDKEEDKQPLEALKLRPLEEITKEELILQQKLHADALQQAKLRQGQKQAAREEHLAAVLASSEPPAQVTCGEQVLNQDPQSPGEADSKGIDKDNQPATVGQGQDGQQPNAPEGQQKQGSGVKLNLNNLKVEQIGKLVSLRIITQEQANAALARKSGPRIYAGGLIVEASGPFAASGDFDKSRRRAGHRSVKQRAARDPHAGIFKGDGIRHSPRAHINHEWRRNVWQASEAVSPEAVRPTPAAGLQGEPVVAPAVAEFQVTSPASEQEGKTGQATQASRYTISEYQNQLSLNKRGQTSFQSTKGGQRTAGGDTRLNPTTNTGKISAPISENITVGSGQYQTLKTHHRPESQGNFPHRLQTRQSQKRPMKTLLKDKLAGAQRAPPIYQTSQGPRSHKSGIHPDKKQKQFIADGQHQKEKVSRTKRVVDIQEEENQDTEQDAIDEKRLNIQLAENHSRAGTYSQRRNPTPGSSGAHSAQFQEMEAQQQENKLDQALDLAEEGDIEDIQDIAAKISIQEDSAQQQTFQATFVQRRHTLQNPQLSEFKDQKDGRDIQILQQDDKSERFPQIAQEKRNNQEGKYAKLELAHKRLEPGLRAQSQARPPTDAQKVRKPLLDGRRHGFFNLTLMAPLDRVRNTHLQGEAKSRRDISIDRVKRARQSIRPGGHSPGSQHRFDADKQFPGAQTSLMSDEFGSIHHSLSQMCKKSVLGQKQDETPSAAIPAELRVQQLHQRLKELGVPLPEGSLAYKYAQRQSPSTSPTALQAYLTIQPGHTSTDAQGAHDESYLSKQGQSELAQDSVEKSVIQQSIMSMGYPPSFNPLHGGHTKNSLIRQELGNYEALREQLEKVIPPRDMQDLDDLKQESVQGRQNLESRIVRFGAAAKGRRLPPVGGQTHQSRHQASVLHTTESIDPGTLGTKRENPPRQHTSREHTDRTRYRIREQFDVSDKTRNCTQGSLGEPFGAKYSGSAVDTTYQGNQRQVGFTSEYSNVWLPSNEMMYKDSQIASDAVRRDREARAVLFQLERQLGKIEAIKQKETKAKLLTHYYETYGIKIPEQQAFFFSPERLKGILIKKASHVVMHRAAARIQHWYLRQLKIRRMWLRIKRICKAVVVIQKCFKRWKANVNDPRKKDVTRHRKAFLIQKFLRGYQARRRVMYDVMNKQADKMFQYFNIIDKVTRGHFQRRVRRAWFAYKKRKEEKRKQKEAEEAAKKGKRGYRRTQVKKPPAPSMTQTLPKPGTTPVQSPNKGGAKPTPSDSPDLDLNRRQTEAPQKGPALALERVGSTITEGVHQCQTEDDNQTPREDDDGEMQGTSTFGKLGGETLDMGEIRQQVKDLEDEDQQIKEQEDEDDDETKLNSRTPKGSQDKGSQEGDKSKKSLEDDNERQSVPDDMWNTLNQRADDVPEGSDAEKNKEEKVEEQDEVNSNQKKDNEEENNETKDVEGEKPEDDKDQQENEDAKQDKEVEPNVEEVTEDKPAEAQEEEEQPPVDSTQQLTVPEKVRVNSDGQTSHIFSDATGGNQQQDGEMAEQRSHGLSLDLSDPGAVLKDDPHGRMRGASTPGATIEPAAQLPLQIESARSKATDRKDDSQGKESDEKEEKNNEQNSMEAEQKEGMQKENSEKNSQNEDKPEMNEQKENEKEEDGGELQLQSKEEVSKSQEQLEPKSQLDYSHKLHDSQKVIEEKNMSELEVRFSPKSQTDDQEMNQNILSPSPQDFPGLSPVHTPKVEIEQVIESPSKEPNMKIKSAEKSNKSCEKLQININEPDAIAEQLKHEVNTDLSFQEMERKSGELGVSQHHGSSATARIDNVSQNIKRGNTQNTNTTHEYLRAQTGDYLKLNIQGHDSSQLVDSGHRSGEMLTDRQMVQNQEPREELNFINQEEEQDLRYNPSQEIRALLENNNMIKVQANSEEQDNEDEPTPAIEGDGLELEERGASTGGEAQQDNDGAGYEGDEGDSSRYSSPRQDEEEAIMQQTAGFGQIQFMQQQDGQGQQEEQQQEQEEEDDYEDAKFDDDQQHEQQQQQEQHSDYSEQFD